MKAKEKILDAALKLFNTQGTGAVSTNHIAEAAGISPGNLYYHFRNKDEIIRALFEQHSALTDEAFNLPTDHLPALADVEAYVTVNFQILSRYRFMFRELVALLHQDAALHQRYLEIRERGYTGFREIVAALTSAGHVAAPLDDATVTRLADLCWLISEFWLASLDISDTPIDDDALRRGFGLMMQVLQPYITA
jgi:AcrR family transcriptional regulator